MILLIRGTSSISSASISFKFHYDSINSLRWTSNPSWTEIFKFHYDSINSRISGIDATAIPVFKFHYDSINSIFYKSQTKNEESHLNSIMILLIPLLGILAIPCGLNLNSIMILLILIPHFEA